MSEWWTYSLSDFLMFSSRSYWRLIESYNATVWPAHLLALAIGAVVMVCVARPGRRTHKTAALLLAAAWAWVGWAVHWQRYADINTAAPYFAAAFGVQAVLLGWAAARPDKHATPPHRLASAIIGLAVVAWPLLALARGGGWPQAEVVGIAPDPTVLATLGVLLAWRAHWSLWPIPVMWCAVSGATLMELQVAPAWLLPVLALAIVVARVATTRPARDVSSTANPPP